MGLRLDFEEICSLSEAFSLYLVITVLLYYYCTSVLMYYSAGTGRSEEHIMGIILFRPPGKWLGVAPTKDIATLLHCGPVVDGQANFSVHSVLARLPPLLALLPREVDHNLGFRVSSAPEFRCGAHYVLRSAKLCAERLFELLNKYEAWTWHLDRGVCII